MPTPAQNTPLLHILTDARSASLRRAAEYYRDNKNDLSEFEVSWTRHKNVGDKLLELAKTCGKKSIILVTVPAIDDRQIKSALQALSQLNKKQCTVRWYHGPDWFDETKSVDNLFTQWIKDQNYTGDDITRNFCKFYDAEETESEAQHNGNDRIESLKNYIEYRLMYLFLGADTDAQALKSIIEAVSSNTEKQFTLPEEADVTPQKMRTLVERYAQFGYPSLAGRSTVIEKLKEQIATYAAADINVLIVGETGTGKEAIAYFLHELSPRRTQEYVTINCACFSNELLESELFGHVKGAFTGAISTKLGLVEKADLGTIFLDELPDASLRTQAKLLRFLESGEFSPVGSDKTKRVDVKIVAGAQPDKLGELRDDFRHRIATGTIETHPLRALNEHWKRNEQHTGKEPDIVTMARNLAVRLRGGYKSLNRTQGFAANRERVTHKDIVAIWKELDQSGATFIDYNWPGNVRELFNIMKKRLCFGVKLDDAIAEHKRIGSHPRGADVTPAVTAALPPDPISFNVTTLDDVIAVEELKIKYVKHVHQRLKAQHRSDKDIRNKLELAPATYGKYKNAGAREAALPTSEAEAAPLEVAPPRVPKPRSR